jgi:hypothetical protein
VNAHQAGDSISVDDKAPTEGLRFMSKPGTETRKTPAVVEPQASRTTVNPGYDTIAILAYDLWLKRGCPVGSAEEDWFQAERALTEQALGGSKSDSTAA